jgi:hypothetical protein
MPGLTDTALSGVISLPDLIYQFAPAGQLKAHKAALLSLLTWDEDEASRLIKDAFSYLCEDLPEGGKT